MAWTQKGQEKLLINKKGIRGRNERVSQINTELGEAYTSLDTLEEDDPEVSEIFANIHDLQTELQNFAENKEMASRQRILNVEQTKKREKLCWILLLN